jgi:hypothetical protein
MVEAPHTPNHKGTATVPNPLRGGVFEGVDLVTGLLLYGTDVIYKLHPTKDSFVLGSSSDDDTDIVVPSGFVSRRHGRFERRTEQGYPILQFVDNGSKNGTYFEGKREPSFSLRPGKLFSIGARMHVFLALNDEMLACHPTLMDILGYEDEHVLGSEAPTPGKLIVSAVGSAHLLITSEPNCGADELAGIVHQISLFRERPPIVLDEAPSSRAQQQELVNVQAARSTIILRLGANIKSFDPTFGSMLFSAKNQLRVIALAPSFDAASKALGKRNVKQMQEIWLRPVSLRRQAIDRLLDRRLIQRGSALRMAHLTSENQAALRKFSWPDNFASLEQVAQYLDVLLAEGSFRPAAKQLGIPLATLHYWYTETMRLSGSLVPRPDGT